MTALPRRLAVPAAGSGPGLVLLRQGEDAETQAIADLYAAEGYVVLSPEPEIDGIGATVAALRGRSECTGKVGALGYCLGGQLAYLTAARTNSDASVGYYGINIQSRLNEAAKIKHPLMLHIAEADEYVPPEAQAKIEAGLKPNPHVTLYRYPLMNHAFARVGGAHYDKANADFANIRSATFFRQNLS